MSNETNLTADRESFSGRAEECSRLEGWLRAGERQVSIIGPSGAGKTRLARQVARRLVPAFEGGVWFCALSSSRTADELVALVASALGIPISQGSNGAGQLAHALAHRGPILLVLDNCEHLDQAALGVAWGWLRRAPNLQILSTSLARFGAAGECVFELGPLEIDDAVALYEARANRAWGGERGFHSGERRAVEELVQRLDRLPLAIELAAARVRDLPPMRMLSQLEDRLELLRSRATDRHSSLEQALHCSWELLNPQERAVLARASIFVGGFTLDAAEEVLAEAGLPSGDLPRTVLDVLDDLRDKALIQLDGSNPPRFTLYESVRVFAARELERSGGVDEAMRQHAAYFLRRKEEWLEVVSTQEVPGAFHRLVAERENFIASFRWLEPRDPSSAVRAGIAASVASGLAGAQASEVGLIDEAVAIARRTGERLLLAHALRVRAVALHWHRTLALARRDVDEALSLARELGESRLEGYLLCQSSGLFWLQTELDRAAAGLSQAFAIASDLGDLHLGGRVRIGLANVADYRGAAADARRWLEEALENFRRCGDVRYQARVLVNLGYFFSGVGEFDGARAAIAEARAIFRSSADRNAEADLLLALGNIEYDSGRLDEAEEHLAAALPLLRSFGIRRWEGAVLGILGSVALERGQRSIALQRLADAVALFRATGDNLELLHHLPILAAVQAIGGQLEEARAALTEARQGYVESRDTTGLAAAELLEGFLGLGMARSAAQELLTEESSSLIAQAAARLARPSAVQIPCSNRLTRARRLLAGALERYGTLAVQADDGIAAAGIARQRDEASIDTETSGVEATGGLLVGPNAEWFEVQGRTRVDVSQRGPRRRLLNALVLHRLLEPGTGLGLVQLWQIGWPGEDFDPLVSFQRVYIAVMILRRSGLGELLMRHDDGYLLATNVAVRRAQG